ncbi:MAG TPA: M6 family metalloprotease domain-containing protein [Gemmatimonadales bacterium]|nr:M6 family metalloprotease domain-containing protein [Gemmatimonadales bacterium]
MLHRAPLVTLVLMIGPLTMAWAQQGPRPPQVRREIQGFDFRKDGVWRRQARAVRALRHRLLARRNFPALNAPIAGGAAVAPRAAGAPLAAGPALSGVVKIPAVLFKFRDTPASEVRTAGQYNDVLFAASPTGASATRPYTYASWYAQLSNGLLTIQGQTYGYAALDSNEVTYTGVAGTCTGNPYPGSTDCNGLFSSDAQNRMQAGLRQALSKLDNQVDWTQYDSDGDGYVDLVAFIQPALDGACGPTGNNHLWSHRFFLTGTPYSTHSTTVVNGQTVQVKVSDYILESGVGGDDGCDTTNIMPMGTVAHETGHGFGLPDLYGTDDSSEGVGEWSLMGSGNYTSPNSPSRMDAWSLSELGWVTVVPLSNGGTYSFGPAPTSDTTFFVPVLGANPRGEYFLLENREAVQSDSAVIHYHCQVWYDSASPPPCGGGLLIYHVDSEQIAQHGFLQDNTVNVGPIHGLEVVQGDGLANLDANPKTASCKFKAPPPTGCTNRGDAGDLYPGTTNNVALTPTSTPAARRNSDGLPANFTIDQIVQLAPNGAMQFRLAFPVWLVRAIDTAAVIQFDGAPFKVFRGILTSGSTHTVAVADTQFTVGGRTRQIFVSWSDGGAISHSFTAGATPETLTVTLARSHRIDYSGTNGGTISASVPSGTFVADGTPVTLTANDTSSVRTFQGWAGDTVTKNLGITLPTHRPYAVRAVFLETFKTADVVAQLLNGTSPLTPAQLSDLDQLGNANGGFDLGDFLAWVQATGAPLTAEQRGRLAALKIGASR